MSEITVFPPSPPIIDVIPSAVINVYSTGGNYIFNQTANLATWTINHNLNNPYPSVVIFDADGDQLLGFELLSVNNNTLTVSFKQPVAPPAIAYLS